MVKSSLSSGFVSPRITLTRTIIFYRLMTPGLNLSSLANEETLLWKYYFPECFLGAQTSGNQCFFAAQTKKHFNDKGLRTLNLGNAAQATVESSQHLFPRWANRETFVAEKNVSEKIRKICRFSETKIFP